MEKGGLILKSWKVIVLLGLLFVLIACKQPTNEEVYYEIQKKLSEMESYQCIAKIQVMNQNQATEYVFQQSFKVPNQYRLEVLSPENLKGSLTMYNGKTAWLQHPAINQTWKLDNFQQSPEQLMFIGYFLENYITSKESTFEIESIGEENYLIMETKIPGGNNYFDHQKLWFDKKQKVPVKLYIYDETGNLRFRVYYEDFTYNPELEESLFHLKDEGS